MTNPVDPVNHPSHYVEQVPGIECIQVTEHFSFLRGNAIKYLWRAGSKGNALEDLKKARWYIDREIANLENVEEKQPTLTPLKPIEFPHFPQGGKPSPFYPHPSLLQRKDDE